MVGAAQGATWKAPLRPQALQLEFQDSRNVTEPTAKRWAVDASASQDLTSVVVSEFLLLGTVSRCERFAPVTQNESA